MEEYLKAGVFFHGSSVRYTEIVESGTEPALLKRLGSCRFDFPVSEALVGGNPELLATLHEALIDVFDGSRLHEVCLAIDPSICLTFQTAIAADVSDEAMRAQILGEMALLADTDTALHVSSDEVFSGEDPDGLGFSTLQVLAFPDVVRERLESIFTGIPGERNYFSSVQGAGNLLLRFLLASTAERSTDGFDVALGQFADRFEYAVCKSGRLLHVQYVPCSTPEDGLFFGANLLSSIAGGRARLNSVYLYGEDLDEQFVDRYSGILGETSLLDPLQVLRTMGSPKGQFDGCTFAQCVGVALAPAN